MPLPLFGMLGLNRLDSSATKQAAAVPPFPKLDHRLTVTAEPDGLYVSSAKLHKSFKIAWGQQGAIQPVPSRKEAAVDASESSTTEAKGLVGVLRLFDKDYLLLITRTEHVASLPSLATLKQQGGSRNIYAIRQVLAVPLEHQAALDTISKHNSSASRQTAGSSSSNSSSDQSDAEPDDIQAAPSMSRSASSQSVQQQKKRGLGTFYWMPSRLYRRPTTDKVPTTKSQEKSPQPKEPDAMESILASSKTAQPISLRDQQSRASLDRRIITELSRAMRHGMHLSYDFDATHSLQSKTHIEQKPVFHEPLVHLPFWQRADPRFWWNRWLSQPLVDAKVDNFVYPIFQGFAEHIEASRPLPGTSSTEGATNAASAAPREVDFDLFIISRRSVDRPGLRYQRRGINTRGGTANFVETEFVTQVDLEPNVDQQPPSPQISEHTDARHHVFSFIQTRGSIPLFWSQSPWALKPVPVLERSEEENSRAISKHFELLKETYGKQLIVNLAEQHGKEGSVVQAYRQHVEALNDTNIEYVDFDFHSECKGMHYENISKLIDRIDGDLEQQNVLWSDAKSVYSRQSGTARVNCMDCLDRTNVVQSALARHVLASSLVRLGLSRDLAASLDRSFNELWASNGDAISLEYAGTSALKGDFTRTGKRDFRGIINDATNSVARLFQNTIVDFFKQAVIDYVLGVNVHAFAEFQEKLETTDPGRLHLLASIRSTAVDTCSGQLIPEGESKVDGWTLLSPTSLGNNDPSTLTAEAFEEKVLLLSDQAIYIVSYEYTLNKVRDYVKIPLECLTRIQHGTLILSTLHSFARDATENYGFILTYQLVSELPQQAHVENRQNTYSLDTMARNEELAEALSQACKDDLVDHQDFEQRVVFKFMRKDIGREEEAGKSASVSSADAVRSIVGAIAAASTKSPHRREPVVPSIKIEEGAIRSLEDAQQGESILYAKFMFNISRSPPSRRGHWLISTVHPQLQDVAFGREVHLALEALNIQAFTRGAAQSWYVWRARLSGREQLPVDRRRPLYAVAEVQGVLRQQE